MLFAKANSENCMVIKEVLDKFCTDSGQIISGAKSRVFFSPNIGQDEEEAFASILGFQATGCLGKYLGFPIRHRGGSNQDFKFVLDRVKTKLVGWKANPVYGRKISPYTSCLFDHSGLCYAEPNAAWQGARGHR